MPMQLPTAVLSFAVLAVSVRSQSSDPQSAQPSTHATEIGSPVGVESPRMIAPQSAVASARSVPPQTAVKSSGRVATQTALAASSVIARSSATSLASDARASSGAAKRAALGIDVRAGSMRAQDSARDADGDVRIERFVLVPAGTPIAAVVESNPTEPRASERGATERESRTGAPVDSRLLLGAVEWRRLAHADGFQIECEILFARAASDLAGQRVLHVEDLCEGNARLVWREMGAGLGRSLLAEWTSGGVALRTIEWDKHETLREEISTSDGAVMPLYLIEMLREGRATSGRYRLFEPLSRTLSEVELFTSYGDATDESGSAAPSECPARSDASSRREPARASSRLRTVELLRADGSLCGRYRFRGAELIAFQWQDGGPWARRASAAEYDAALGELERRCADDP
jgi:hypothetical protein